MQIIRGVRVLSVHAEPHLVNNRNNHAVGRRGITKQRPGSIKYGTTVPKWMLITERAIFEASLCAVCEYSSVCLVMEDGRRSEQLWANNCAKLFSMWTENAPVWPRFGAVITHVACWKYGGGASVSGHWGRGGMAPHVACHEADVE